MNIRIGLITLLLCSVSGLPMFGFGSKTKPDIPKEVTGDGKLWIEDIRQYLFDPATVTLNFFITEDSTKGVKMSFLANFSQRQGKPSRLTLRVRNGKELTDYNIRLGSGFAKNLSKRLSPVAIKKEERADKRAEYLNRIHSLRQLLAGTYTRKKGVDPRDNKPATAPDSKAEDHKKTKFDLDVRPR